MFQLDNNIFIGVGKEHYVFYTVFWIHSSSHLWPRCHIPCNQQGVFFPQPAALMALSLRSLPSILVSSNGADILSFGLKPNIHAKLTLNFQIFHITLSFYNTTSHHPHNIWSYLCNENKRNKQKPSSNDK